MLSEYCSHVTVLQNLSFMTGEKKLVDILKNKDNVTFVFDTLVTELVGEESLTALKLHNVKTGEDSELSVKVMFFAIGQKPENECFKNITVLNEHGYIVAGEDCTTDTEGIFVAGDCRTKAVRQVTTASADGAVAALAACEYLDN